MESLKREYITPDDLKELASELKLWNYGLRNALVVLDLQKKSSEFAARLHHLIGLGQLIKVDHGRKNRRARKTTSKTEKDYVQLCKDLKLEAPLKNFDKLKSCLQSLSNFKVHPKESMIRIFSAKISYDLKVFSSEAFELLQSTLEKISSGELQASSTDLKMLHNRNYLLSRARNKVNSEIGYNPFDRSIVSISDGSDQFHSSITEEANQDDSSYKLVDNQEDFNRDLLILASARGESPDLYKQLNDELRANNALSKARQASLANEYQKTPSEIKSLFHDLEVLETLHQDYEVSTCWIRETAVAQVRESIKARCTNAKGFNREKFCKFDKIFSERTCKAYFNEAAKGVEDLARILGVTKGRISQLDGEFKILLKEALTKAHKQETTKFELIKSLQETQNFNRRKQLMLLDVLVFTDSDSKIALRWGIKVTAVKSMQLTVARLLVEKQKRLYSLAS